MGGDVTCLRLPELLRVPVASSSVKWPFARSVNPLGLFSSNEWQESRSAYKAFGCGAVMDSVSAGLLSMSDAVAVLQRAQRKADAG